MNTDHEIIETRAYELYLERNGRCGDPLVDWLRAEQEVEKVNTERIGKNPLSKTIIKHGGPLRMRVEK